MKKTILIMCLLLLVSFTFSQEKLSKTKMFGINPFALLLKMYVGHFGVIINDGANEINVPFFYWHPKDNLKLIGFGLKYRFYKNKTGKGAFYGPLVKLDWQLHKKLEEDDKDSFAFTPGAEIGYRWAWKSGFTIAPTIGTRYTIGKKKSSTGEESIYTSNGISWRMELGLAYMW